MNYIPQNLIEEILSRADIVQLIQSHLPLKKTGKNFSACCPFHDEKTPSFTVSPDKQFYYCFGCSKSGNALGFLMDYRQLTFVEAAQELAKLTGTVIPETQQENRVQQQITNKLSQALLTAESYYTATLKQLPHYHPAQKYLKQRNITTATAEQFSIGYAPSGWDHLLKHLPTQKIAVADGIASGLISNNEQRQYDRFRDRIMFPIHNAKGKVIGFGGRVLGDGKPKYLNSPETPLFQKQKELYGLNQVLNANRRPQEILVVEGYFDVIRLHQQQLPIAVATLGTSTSDYHLNKLFTITDKIVFCFDADSAGRKAAWRALEAAISKINGDKHCAFLFLPENEDPDSFVAKSGKAAFLAQLDTAKPLADFFFDQLSESENLASLDGKARLAKKATGYIRAIQSPLYKELMLEQLAQITGIETSRLTSFLSESPSQNLSQNLNQSFSQNASPPPAQAQGRKNEKRTNRLHNPYKTGTHVKFDQTPQTSKLPSILETSLKLLLKNTKLAQLEIDHEIRKLELPHIEIFLELYDLLRSKPDTSIAYLLGLWHNTPKGELISELAAKDFLIADDKINLEFQDALRQLVAIRLDQAIEQEINAGIPDKKRIQDLLKKKQTADLTKTDA